MIFILYVQVKTEIFFIFTLSIKSVQIFCYDHLGEILPATKHQREKYASFRLLKLAEPRQKAKSSNFKKTKKEQIRLMKHSCVRKGREGGITFIAECTQGI